MNTSFAACRPFVTVMMLTCLISCSSAVHDPQVKASKDIFLKTRRTYLQGAVVGAVLGAGTGAIIGNQSNNKNGALVGALVGTGVGALGGLLYAKHVVNQRQAYANAAAYLKACTKIAREQKNAAEKYNSTLAQRTNAVRANSKVVSGTIQDSKVVLARLKQEIELQESALTQAQQEKVSGEYAAAQSSQINALKAEQRRLEAHIERLSQNDEPAIIGGN